MSKCTYTALKGLSPPPHSLTRPQEQRPNTTAVSGCAVWTKSQLVNSVMKMDLGLKGKMLEHETFCSSGPP